MIKEILEKNGVQIENINNEFYVENKINGCYYMCYLSADYNDERIELNCQQYIKENGFKLSWLDNIINWDLGYYENEFMVYGEKPLFILDDDILIIKKINFNNMTVDDEKDVLFQKIIAWLYANNIKIVNDLNE